MVEHIPILDLDDRRFRYITAQVSAFRGKSQSLEDIHAVYMGI